MQGQSRQRQQDCDPTPLAPRPPNYSPGTVADGGIIVFLIPVFEKQNTRANSRACLDFGIILNGRGRLTSSCFDEAPGVLPHTHSALDAPLLLQSLSRYAFVSGVNQQ
jgi:hypothetical protein